MSSTANKVKMQCNGTGTSLCVRVCMCVGLAILVNKIMSTDLCESYGC